MTEKFICFDIGGTKIFQSVTEIDFGKRKFDFLDSKTIDNPVDAEKIKQLVLDYCEKNKKKFDTNKVAISTSKIVDYEKQSVRKASPIYGVENFEFSFLKKAGFQVVIENDGEAFALGECYFNDNEDRQGLLTLTLGSGLGGGFINSKNQVLRGRNNSATEFSHIKMFINDKWECWEDISAGRGIERLYQVKTGKKKKAKEIFEKIKNDEISKEVIYEAQKYLGQGIANLIDIFNPEKIIFGGSVAFQKDYIEGAMEISRANIFHEEAFPVWSISELKAEMNVLGVCALYYV